MRIPPIPSSPVPLVHGAPVVAVVTTSSTALKALESEHVAPILSTPVQSRVPRGVAGGAVQPLNLAVTKKQGAEAAAAWAVMDVGAQSPSSASEGVTMDSSDDEYRAKVDRPNSIASAELSRSSTSAFSVVKRV